MRFGRFDLIGPFAEVKQRNLYVEQRCKLRLVKQGAMIQFDAMHVAVVGHHAHLRKHFAACQLDLLACNLYLLVENLYFWAQGDIVGLQVILHLDFGEAARSTHLGMQR